MESKSPCVLHSLKFYLQLKRQFQIFLFQCGYMLYFRIWWANCQLTFQCLFVLIPEFIRRFPIIFPQKTPWLIVPLNAYFAGHVTWMGEADWFLAKHPISQWSAFVLFYELQRYNSVHRSKILDLVLISLKYLILVLIICYTTYNFWNGAIAYFELMQTLWIYQ